MSLLQVVAYVQIIGSWQWHRGINQECSMRGSMRGREVTTSMAKSEPHVVKDPYMILSLPTVQLNQLG